MAADLVNMALHGLGVGKRQSQSGPGAARRANRAKQIRTLVALIGRLAGSGAAPCPLPHDAVLLADAGFILEPKLHLPPSCAATGRKDAPSACVASFFEFLDNMGILARTQPA